MSQPIVMPDLGSGTDAGTLINWLKQVGDSIKEGDIIAEVETDKATVEVPANIGGTIIELVGNPGDALATGSVIGQVGEAGEKAAAPAQEAPAKTEAAKPAEQPAAPATPAASNGKVAAEAAPSAPADGNLPDGVRVSPLARRIAFEKGLDLRTVKGTGPGGRIVKEDVINLQAPAARPAAVGSSLGAPTYGEIPTQDVELIDVTRIRATIARRMVDSKQQVPHFYVTSEIDVAALLDLRKQLNANLDDEHKISVNDLIVKATALTLRKFPNLNSHFYGDKIVRHKRINIGIAVALPDGGLMNVVSPDADKASLSTIAADNKAKIARARDRKVKPDDVQGSTFTVSNLGAFDVNHFSAIINPPEAGILAIGSARKIPVVKEDGSIGVGNRMNVTISVDHRVSDGAEAAQYLQAFKQLIENPMQLVV